mmetsp:Transcript_96589/g.300834  ORF Transcript_96589/g.300834 Transcript_96589/m.300834 type:complete len:277 (+) Transcript_96589:498-1328(+)
MPTCKSVWQLGHCARTVSKREQMQGMRAISTRTSWRLLTPACKGQQASVPVGTSRFIRRTAATTSEVVVIVGVAANAGSAKTECCGMSSSCWCVLCPSPCASSPCTAASSNCCGAEPPPRTVTSTPSSCCCTCEAIGLWSSLYTEVMPTKPLQATARALAPWGQGRGGVRPFRNDPSKASMFVLSQGLLPVTVKKTRRPNEKMSLAGWGKERPRATSGAIHAREPPNGLAWRVSTRERPKSKSLAPMMPGVPGTVWTNVFPGFRSPWTIRGCREWR